MAGPQLAQPAPLLVDQQQDRLDNSWTQPLIKQSPAWPRHVQGLIEAQIGDVDVAEHVMRNAQQVMHRSARLSSKTGSLLPRPLEAISNQMSNRDPVVQPSLHSCNMRAPTCAYRASSLRWWIVTPIWSALLYSAKTDSLAMCCASSS